MDIYSYLNSPDVAAHCRKIGHSFNALESAYIINDCRSISIEKKHQLYREIMDTMPDVTIQKTFWIEKHDASFFINLENLISEEQELIERIRMQEENAVYMFSYYYPEDAYRGEDDYLYSSFNAVMDALKEFAHGEKGNFILTVYKKYVDTKEQIFCILNSSFEICFIKPKELELLDVFWVYIPTPFQRGDLLCGVGDGFGIPVMPNQQAMVLTNLCYEDSRENWFEYDAKSCDSSDMTAYGYFLDVTGHVYDECIHAYHNLVYYTGELHRSDNIYHPVDNRLLKAISAEMKGEINVHMLLIANDAVRAERRMREAHPGWDYCDEYYQAAGIGDILAMRELVDKWEKEQKAARESTGNSGNQESGT